MRILHTADLHLKAVGDERWDALRTIADVCQQEAVNLLAICGDLFDSSADAEDLRPHIRDVLSSGDFQTLIIPGNHDIDAYKEGFFFGDRVSVLNNPDWHRNSVRLDEVHIIGLPFEEELDKQGLLRKLQDLSSSLDPGETNILLYHGELLDTFYDRADFGPEEARRYMPAHLHYFEQVPVRYVLAGHFHAKFDVWKIGERGYFVYPGSPVSITRRELGQRRVNLLEAGQAPSEYRLDTPHFLSAEIKLTPMDEKGALDSIGDALRGVHPAATTLLTIGGYVAQAEDELVSQIKDFLAGRPVEAEYMFRDVSRVLEHRLFGMFERALAEGDYDDRRAEQLRDLAIRAMIEAQL